MRLSETDNLKTETPPKRLEPFDSKGFRTKREVMKCESMADDILLSSKTKFHSEKGGTGEMKSFPQDKLAAVPLHRKDSHTRKSTASRNVFLPTLPARIAAQTVEVKNTKAQIPKPKLHRRTVPNTSFRENGIPKALSETIAAIQDAVQKLDWPIGQINNFIAQNFQGRRRAQLSDGELTKLLYHLRVQYLETVKAEPNELQRLEVVSPAING